MIIKTIQTLVFEYPEDYQAEVEWNKKRDGDWVHQSRDTMCSVYTLTNNYLIPTKTKHSFLDNPYFEAEPQNDCEGCKHYVYQLGCTHHANCEYEPKDEPQTERSE